MGYDDPNYQNPYNMTPTDRYLGQQGVSGDLDLSERGQIASDLAVSQSSDFNQFEADKVNSIFDMVERQQGLLKNNSMAEFFKKFAHDARKGFGDRSFAGVRSELSKAGASLGGRGLSGPIRDQLMTRAMQSGQAIRNVGEAGLSGAAAQFYGGLGQAEMNATAGLGQQAVAGISGQEFSAPDLGAIFNEDEMRGFMDQTFQQLEDENRGFFESLSAADFTTDRGFAGGLDDILQSLDKADFLKFFKTTGIYGG